MRSLSTELSIAIRTLIVIALGVTAFLLMAFGPRPTDQFPKDATIIDYWEHWNGDEEAAMRQIVNDFNSGPGETNHIFVRYLSTSGIEQKTLVATAGGMPPDIAGLYNQDIPQFAALDALTPLDDLAAAHGLTAGTYKKVFWDECHYDGRLYGLVSTAFDLALYYNREIFQERAAALQAHGLDPNRAPGTLAELDDYGQALDQRDTSGHIDIAGYLPLEPGWYQNYTCIWFGGKWWDDKHRKFTFTDPGVVRAYTWIQSYSRRLGTQAETEFRSSVGGYDSPQNSFLAGKVAMEQQGTFLAGTIEHQKPSMQGNWAAAPFPSADPALKNVTYCNCDVLVIPRGAKHPAEAFEFMAFVNTQKEMEKLANLHCKISPLASVSDQFLSHHRNPYIRVFDALAASPNAHPSEPIPILNEVTDEMNNFVQKLALLQVTPEQGLQDMQNRLQKTYDDFIEEQRERRALAH
jgi:multiple sugar transport system substrate-binding protein